MSYKFHLFLILYSIDTFVWSSYFSLLFVTLAGEQFCNEWGDPEAMIGDIVHIRCLIVNRSFEYNQLLGRKKSKTKQVIDQFKGLSKMSWALG